MIPPSFLATVSSVFVVRALLTKMGGDRLVAGALCAFYLFQFPFGTLLGLFTIWALWESRKRSKATGRPEPNTGE